MSDLLRPEDASDRGALATGQMSRQGFLLRAAAGGVLIASSPQLDDRLEGASATRGGVLKMARNEEAQSFDPIVPGDNGSIYTIQQIFDQLTRINNDSTFVSPGLAKSWSISADRKTYTFHLRDAKFSNGAPVTADDVIFSLGRTFNPKVCFYSFLFAGVKSVTKVNSRTVKIVLTTANTPLLESLSVFAAAIVPAGGREEGSEGLRPASRRQRPVLAEAVLQGPVHPPRPQPPLLAEGQAVRRRGSDGLRRRRQHAHPQAPGRRGRRGHADPLHADRAAQQGRHSRPDRAALPLGRHLAQSREEAAR